MDRWSRAGIDWWWRNVIGGAATTRFHRPPAGIGLSNRAKAQIRGARMLLRKIDIFKATPDTASGLLGNWAAIVHR